MKVLKPMVFNRLKGFSRGLKNSRKHTSPRDGLAGETTILKKMT